MAGRTYRNESVGGFARDHGVDCLARRPGSAHSCFQRMNRDHRVTVQITNSLAHGALDMLVELRTVTGLNVAATGLSGFNLDHVRPQLGVTAQRIHYGRVTRRLFRMAGTGIVLLEDWMMDYGGGHYLVGQSRTNSVLK